MQPRVLITRMLPEEAVTLLRQHCDVQLDVEDRHLEPAALRQAVADKDGIICVITDRIDAAVLQAAPSLKVVANVAAGYDNIDVPAATQRGVMVTNTPGAVTESTADLAWALLFAVARRIVEGDRYIRTGQWHEWRLMVMLGNDIHGKTLGIYGMGRIGQAVARRAAGFGMRILYHNRNRVAPEIEAALGATWVNRDTLFQQADFLSLHTPLTPETHHLINLTTLRMMRSTAYLINTSRGSVVDENALIQALQEGWIAGAGLDVFEKEPEVPAALQALSNVVLVPHIGSASVATRTRMAVMAASNLLSALRGERPQHIINPQACVPR